MADILVLYYSGSGSIQEMAKLIARGVNKVSGTNARIRTVPKVSANTERVETSPPATGNPYVAEKDLEECIGLALGSPTRFGNMAAPLKYFLDSLSGAWLKGTLSGKPASVFTSAGSMHGGQEVTLLSMAVPLLHHDMIFLGIPFTHSELRTTTSGGTPYGSSHYAGDTNNYKISDEERKLCIAQGERLAITAIKLAK